MTNGRNVPNPNEFTFESGKKVKITKVPQYLINDVEKSIPKPPIPTQEIMVMGAPSIEENESDPDYQQALKERTLKVGQAVMELAIDEGVEFDLSDEQIEEELERFRERMKKRNPPIYIEDSLSTKTLYLLYICKAGQQELSKLAQRIFRVSQPTEEAVAEAAATF